MLGRCLSRRVSCCISATRICSAAFSSASSSAVPAKQPGKSNRSSFDMSRLTKILDSELRFQENLVKEGSEKAPTQVAEEYARMLGEQDWTLEGPVDSLEVKLKTKRGDMEIVVSWDAEMVADAVNEIVDEEACEEEEEQEDDESYAEEDSEYAEDSNPFNVSVRLSRESQPGKHFELELEVAPGPSPGSGDAIYLNSLSIVPVGGATTATYSGPRIDQLDVELKEQLESWTERNLKHLVPFIVEYSRAKEAGEYGKWLADLKTFTSA